MGSAFTWGQGLAVSVAQLHPTRGKEVPLNNKLCGKPRELIFLSSDNLALLTPGMAASRLPPPNTEPEHHGSLAWVPVQPRGSCRARLGEPPWLPGGRQMAEQ